MDLYTYQNLAKRTESIIDAVEADKNELNHVLAAFVTVSEMLDCLKKKIYYKNSKKYNEKFTDLARSLTYFSSSIDRHHSEPVHEEVLEGVDPRVFHAIIGIATESGELVSALQSNINGHELDGVNVCEEWGDASWYGIGILHDALGVDPVETLRRNIAKLAARYPEKYTDEAAEHRNLDTERQILEGKQ